MYITSEYESIFENILNFESKQSYFDKILDNRFHWVEGSKCKNTVWVVFYMPSFKIWTGNLKKVTLTTSSLTVGVIGVNIKNVHRVTEDCEPTDYSRVANITYGYLTNKLWVLIKSYSDVFQLSGNFLLAIWITPFSNLEKNWSIYRLHFCRTLNVAIIFLICLQYRTILAIINFNKISAKT